MGLWLWVALAGDGPALSLEPAGGLPTLQGLSAEADEAPDPSAGAAPETLAPLESERPGVRFVPERWTIPPESLSAVRSIPTRPFYERLEAATRPWLGLPYQVDAAGEFTPPDPDPVARYDTFDCLTFVEEALGIALAADPLYAPTIRDALRYGGPSRQYADRKHFMEAQWLPEAVRLGLLDDVTAQVGPTKLVQHTVTPALWKNWRYTRLFDMPFERFPVGTWSMPYLDLATAVANVARIPPGALIMTVRKPKAHAPIAITHVSLVVQDPNGEVTMRHATKMGARKVRDDRLDWYVKHLYDYVNWPSLGIAVYLPREQGPRVSALTPMPEPSQPMIDPADQPEYLPMDALSPVGP